MSEMDIYTPEGKKRFEIDPFGFIKDHRIQVKAWKLWQFFKSMQGFADANSLCMQIANLMDDYGATHEDIVATFKYLTDPMVCKDFNFASQVMGRMNEYASNRIMRRKQKEKAALDATEEINRPVATEGDWDKFKTFISEYRDTANTFTEESLRAR